MIKQTIFEKYLLCIGYDIDNRFGWKKVSTLSKMYRMIHSLLDIWLYIIKNCRLYRHIGYDQKTTSLFYLVCNLFRQYTILIIMAIYNNA